MYLVVTLVSIILSAATVNCLIIAPQLTLDYLLFISSDRSSYSDSVLLLVWQLFQILSISANMLVFLFEN